MRGIKPIYRKLLFTAIVYCCCLHIQAQVKFYTVVTEQSISANPSFQVQYIVEGTKNIKNFNVPRYRHFRVNEVLDQPNASVLNSNTLKLADAYSKTVILTPLTKGRLNIAGATAVINGKLMHSNSISVMVGQLKEDETADDLVTDESEIRSGENIEDKIKKNFFLTAELNKTECYVGEPLMALYKACSRLNASSHVVKRPSLTGFSVIEMVDNYDGKPVVEDIDGKAFYTHLIRKVQLFPLQPGIIDLDAAQVESVIHFIKNASDPDSNSELQQLLSTPGEDTQVTATRFDHKVTLTTAPLTVMVKPLPDANQPENFSGAVGQFFISTEIADEDILQNEMATMRVVISGKGNLPLITPPFIKWPSSAEVSQPSVHEVTNKYFYPLSGSKTFEYTFSVKDTGVYNIPPVEFSYFDPVLKNYKTIKSNFDSFHVKQAALVKNIKPANPPIATPTSSFPRQLYWFALLILIICGWIFYQLALLIKYRKQQRNGKIEHNEETLGDELLTQAKPDEFAKAEEALIAGNRKAFYLAVESALWNVVAEKYKLLPSALNKQNVKGVLASKNVSAECIKHFIAVLDECEWALYTTATDEKDMQSLLAAAKKITSDILHTVCDA